MLVKTLDIIVYDNWYIGERPVAESGKPTPLSFQEKTMIRSWTSLK